MESKGKVKFKKNLKKKYSQERINYIKNIVLNWFAYKCRLWNKGKK